jgi:hypothetical protein
MTPGADAPRPLSKADGDEKWNGMVGTIPPPALVPQPQAPQHDPAQVRYRHTKAGKALRRALVVLMAGEGSLARDMALVAASLLQHCPCPACASVVIFPPPMPGSDGRLATGS